MKSRDEIVIIMLQWLRLYTLGSRGSRELKTFLETRLISSRVDQKLKNKRREYMLLKGKLGLKSWVMETIVKAVCCRRGGDSLGLGCGLTFAALLTKFSGEFGSFFHNLSATSGPRSSHDRVTIKLRSWSEVFADHLPIGGGRFRSDPAPFSPRSRFDRAAIAARSRRDRGVLPQPLHAVRSSFR